jgi:hypothetical protein
METYIMFRIMIGTKYQNWKLNNNVINYLGKLQFILILEKAICLTKKLLKLLMNNK